MCGIWKWKSPSSAESAGWKYREQRQIKPSVTYNLPTLFPNHPSHSKKKKEKSIWGDFLGRIFRKKKKGKIIMNPRIGLRDTLTWKKENTKVRQRRIP